MKKVLALCLALVLVCTAVTGCGSSKDDTTGTGSTGTTGTTADTGSKEEESTDKPIVFAYSGPLTGDNAEYGTLFKNAVELAIKQTNESGGLLGRQIELLTFDDKNAAEEAGTIAEQIVGNDDVVAVFGHFASSVAMTAAQTYQEEGIVLMSASASHVDYSSIGDYIFRNNVTQSVEAANILQIAIRDGVKKLGVLKLKTDWGESAETALMQAYDKIKDKYPMEITVEEFVDGTTDFSSNITKFEEAQCDGVAVLGMYAALGAFTKQFRQINKDTRIVSAGSSYTPELINLAGEAANGIEFPGGMNPNSTDPTVKAFVDAYTEYSGGKAPENMSAQTYENVMMVIECIKEIGTTDREAIKDHLYEMSYPGITATLEFNEIGDVVKSQNWYKVENGEFVEQPEKLVTFDEFAANYQ